MAQNQSYVNTSSLLKGVRLRIGLQLPGNASGQEQGGQ